MQDDDGIGEAWLDIIEIVNMAAGTVSSAQLPIAGAQGCAAVYDGYYYYVPGQIPPPDPIDPFDFLTSNLVYRKAGKCWWGLVATLRDAERNLQSLVCR